jgi:5'-3' exonuclease
MVNRVILIDNGFLVHRSIFAFRSSGMYLGYLYLRMLLALIKKLKYSVENDLVIIAIDSKLGSWRKVFIPVYKSNRKSKREALESSDWWKECFKEIEQILKTLDLYSAFHIVEEAYTEADDIISVAVRYFQNKECIIVSSDSDLEQLAVYPNVKIFSIISKKFKNIKNPLKVLEEKIVKGDVADNITNPENIDIELRRKIFSLLSLPLEIETRIRTKLVSILENKKQFDLSKIPYRSIKEDLTKLLKGEIL